MFFKSRKKEPVVAHLYYRKKEEDIENYSLAENTQNASEKPGVCRTTAYKIYAQKSREQDKQK